MDKGTIQVESLYCEKHADPAGIEIPQPRLSWILGKPEAKPDAVAYRILVTDNPENLNEERGDIWDWGKSRIGAVVLVKYQGSRLKPATKYYWKVMDMGPGRERL
jgi:alpha-L-rhamnosidase